MLQESKACRIFWKTSISYPLLRTLTCAYQEVKMFIFQKFWRGLFSCNTHFEIRPFPLLPTIYQTTSPWQLFWICYLSIQIRVRYHQDQFFSIRKKKQTKKQLKRTKQLKTVNSDFRKKKKKETKNISFVFSIRSWRVSLMYNKPSMSILLREKCPDMELFLFRIFLCSDQK